MKLKKGEIAYIGFVSDDLKDQLEVEIRALVSWESNLEPSVSSNATGIFGFNRVEWVSRQVPEDIGPFKELSISLGKFHVFPYTTTLIVNGIISDKDLGDLEKMDEKTCRETLRVYKNKLWNFCKDLNAMKNTEKFFRDGCCVPFYFIQVSDTEEVLGKEWESDMKATTYNLREKSILNNLDANTIGLLSLTSIYSNQVTILAQSNSVMSGSGIDFSSISVFVFGSQEDKAIHDFKYMFSYGRVLVLLFSYMLLMETTTSIPRWRTDIVKLRKEIQDFQSIKNSITIDSTELVAAEQGHFLAEYSRYLEEYSLTESLAQETARSLQDLSDREVYIPNPTMIALQMGVLSALLQEVDFVSKALKSEFEALNGQYDKLASFRTDLLNLASAKSNLKVARSNTKLQWALAIMTGAVVALTVVLLVKG